MDRFRDGFAPLLCNALNVDLVEWHKVTLLVECVWSSVNCCNALHRYFFTSKAACSPSDFGPAARSCPTPLATDRFSTNRLKFRLGLSSSTQIFSEGTFSNSSIESLDDLFGSVHYLKPVADFRDEVAAALLRRAATQLIELCQVECTPRVSFETAETKTKER